MLIFLHHVNFTRKWSKVPNFYLKSQLHTQFLKVTYYPLKYFKVELLSLNYFKIELLPPKTDNQSFGMWCDTRVATSYHVIFFLL